MKGVAMSDRSGTRRAFMGALTMAGTVGLLGLRPQPAAAEPPPETTRLRLTFQSRVICTGLKYFRELLESEGFTDLQHAREESLPRRLARLASGEADIEITYAAPLIARIDAGDPILVVAGAHAGCFELFATKAIRTIRDLKGKAVAIDELGGTRHVYIASMAAYVGLDPRKDIKWVTYPAAEAMRLLAEGKIDAMIATPPEPQELRAKHIARVVVNSTTDRPWSQYFCCVVAGNREFVRVHPVATKRAVRAMLKAADLCAAAPERAAQVLIDNGVTARYEYVVQTLRELPYGRWREYDLEDTVRFYALRLHEAGIIRSTPQKIIAQGTDSRFMNELKKELKG
jgi:NitT/TauT family transport system substrate-binding protein